MDGARQFARNTIALFAGLDVEAIVMNSAGCGAYMKEYGHVFADDDRLSSAAAEISNKVKDITEYLCEIGFQPAQRNGRSPYSGKRVTYHDACHLAHTQKIVDPPRQLIRAVPGVLYRELPESTWCCGSAGIYNVVRYDDSMKILERKMDNIRQADPDIIVTGNPGCLLQIRHGLRQHGMEVELLHTATFLRRACGI
jgi:glycolate oxidase iron-sulfur subunit